MLANAITLSRLLLLALVVWLLYFGGATLKFVAFVLTIILIAMDGDRQERLNGAIVSRGWGRGKEGQKKASNASRRAKATLCEPKPTKANLEGR